MLHQFYFEEPSERVKVQEISRQENPSPLKFIKHRFLEINLLPADWKTRRDILMRDPSAFLAGDYHYYDEYLSRDGHHDPYDSPKDNYGPPKDSYGPPKDTYGSTDYYKPSNQ